jgi:O-antigen/teichoic acid export membrane protein
MIAALKRLAAGDFVRHGALIFVSMTTINALGYAFHFAISRKVGVEQYGVLAALNGCYMIGMVVSSIAGIVVVKYAAEFRATGDQARLAALARRLSFYGLGVALASAAVGLAFAAAIAAFLKIASIAAVSLCVVVMSISTLTPTLRAVFSGIEDFWTFSISGVMESTLKAVLGVGAVYAGYGVVGAFAGWAFGSAITLAYTMIVLLARFRSVPPAPIFIDFRRLWATMAGVSASTVLLTAISYTDVIIVKHYADATTAGLYGALALSGKILFFLVGFVPTVLLPKATREARAGKSPVGILGLAVATVLGFSSVGLVVYYFFPAFVITALAGPSFAPAAPYVFFYGVAMVLLAALYTVTTFKIGIHRFDFVLPLAICAVAEVAGISVYHRSLSQIVSVLVVCNALALVASAYRINAPLRTLARAQPSDAAA